MGRSNANGIVAEPVIGGELCLRLKILDHGSVRTFDYSLRVCGFVTRPRPRSAGPGRARGGGAAGRRDRAAPGRIPYSIYIIIRCSGFHYVFTRFFTSAIGMIGRLRISIFDKAGRLSRDRQRAMAPCTPRTSPRPLAAPLTLNRLPGRTGILHHPAMRWSKKPTFETTFACFAVPS